MKSRYSFENRGTDRRNRPLTWGTEALQWGASLLFWREFPSWFFRIEGTWRGSRPWQRSRRSPAFRWGLRARNRRAPVPRRQGCCSQLRKTICSLKKKMTWSNLRGSDWNFGIFFIIGPILLKFVTQYVKSKKKHFLFLKFFPFTA